MLVCFSTSVCTRKDSSSMRAVDVYYEGFECLYALGLMCTPFMADLELNRLAHLGHSSLGLCDVDVEGAVV